MFVRVCPCLSVFVGIHRSLSEFIEIHRKTSPDCRKTSPGSGSGYPEQYHGVPPGSVPRGTTPITPATPPPPTTPAPWSAWRPAWLHGHHGFTRLLLVTTCHTCYPLISAKLIKWLFFVFFMKRAEKGHKRVIFSRQNRLLILDMTTFW